jgi:Transcription initiation factor IID, 31kD subunit
MGATQYEPRVVLQLAERMRKYTADLLYDARDYANHAAHPNIEVTDVRLAVQERKFSAITNVPQRDVSYCTTTAGACISAACAHCLCMYAAERSA